MKKKIWIATCLAALFFISNLQAQSNKLFTINGEIKNFKPSFIFLDYDMNEQPHTDSVKVTNGKFIFHGQVNNPKPATIYFKEKIDGEWTMTNYVEFYAEPGNISVRSNDSLSNSTIKAAGANADNAELNSLLKPVFDEWKITLANYPTEFKDSASEKAANDILSDKIDSLDHELINIRRAFAKSHPNSFVALYALKQTSGNIPDAALIEPIFNSFSADIKNSQTGLDYAKKLQVWNKLKVGVAAPDFSLSDTSGKQFTLHNFKGKYILVDFWASWCVPCRAENPNVLKAYNKYKDKNFYVIGVSLDDLDDKSKWIKAVIDDKLPWLQLSDLKGWKGDVPQLYDVQAIPQNYLIDPNGIIVAKDLRGDELQNKLKEIFSN